MTVASRLRRAFAEAGMSPSDVKILIVRLDRAGDPRRANVTTDERQDCCRRARDLLLAVRDHLLSEE